MTSIKKISTALALLALGLMVGCSQKSSETTSSSGKKFRVLQLGDSHTAGEFFTDEVRRRLQAKLGNGGIGFIPPLNFNGQRVATMQYQNNGWSGLISRKDSGDFPLGGMMAQASQTGSVTLIPRQHSAQAQIATFTLKALNPHSELTVASGGKTQKIHGSAHQWQHHRVNTALPLSYQNSYGSAWQIGAIHLENAGGNGAVVSALGINGAQLSQWQKWRTQWREDLKVSQADVIVLAYGTNEAFNANLNLAQTEQHWRSTIRTIRQTLPNAEIVILGAPESLSAKQGECGVRPPMLDAVQAMQQRLSQQEKVRFWSWEKAMGGRCSMMKWIEQGLAAKDGVHFTRAGYEAVARQFANDLLKLVK